MERMHGIKCQSRRKRSRENLPRIDHAAFTTQYLFLDITISRPVSFWFRYGSPGQSREKAILRLPPLYVDPNIELSDPQLLFYPTTNFQPNKMQKR